ncbi:MAG: PEP-CTERM sorting domain-containing protein [Gammaproteobacteria bacterium]|nr:PEP-CTERM sorting domain-containing protein [Gammaproteobacteria bacterium]
MKLLKNAMSAVALSLAIVGTANATIVFEDNFNSYNGGVGALNYTGFSSTWSVMDGTVDLIGNGFFDFLPGNGLYIDLDGSTANAGIMGHLESLAPGDYTLSFDLAGNQRDASSELTTANIAILLGSGTAASTNISLAQNVGFTTYNLNFSISDLLNPSVVMFSFGASGGDNIGMLLDNVVLQDRISVPEPGILSMLALGLLGIGLSRRKIA